MAVTGTLEQIREKVRRITGRLSVNQLTNEDLDDYINDFYIYDLPQHLRLWNLKENYTLDLIPTQNIYNYPFNTNITIEPPCYVDGYEIQLFQSQEEFYNVFPNQRRLENFATATGIAGPYAGTLTGTPITRNSVRITVVDAAGTSLVAQDNGAGTFTGNVVAGSTINYVTGAVAALTWTSAIANGTIMEVHYLNWQQGRPFAVLFFNDELTFYPVPDGGYEFSCQTFINPIELTAGNQPEIRDWWNLIAYGTAQKIFAENLDMESYAKIEPLFDKHKRLVERRTLVQLKNQRASTIYTQQPSGRVPFSSTI